MRNKLKFLVKNKQSIIALFVLLVMVFNACSSPVDLPAVNPDDFLTLKSFYVDSGGNFTETDLGRTAFVVDDKADVVFYSDNIESSDYDHVGLTFEDKSIVVFFEKDQNFPNRIVLSDSEGSYNGIFTPYDSETQTYSLTLDYGDEKETFSNIALSKDIFTQYKENPELTPSQNLRIRNLYITACIYKSLNETITSDGTQARGFWSSLKNFFTPRVILICSAVVVGVAAAVIASPATGWSLASGIITVGDIILTIYEQIEKITTTVTGISLNKDYIRLVVGGEETLTPIITPANAADKSVIWSSDPRVAQFLSSITKNTDNTVYGIGVGKITIKAATQDGGYEATCTVEVDFPNPVPADYTISGIGTFTYNGSTRVVTVTPKAGKSTGAVTVKYNGDTAAPSAPGTYTVTFDVAATASYYAANGLAAGKLTINKATGATVSTPTLNTRTHTSITINPVSAPSTGQSVEYAINTSTAAPSTGWQTTTTFSGLNAGTNYNIFARSASNINYNTGTASRLAVTTLERKVTGMVIKTQPAKFTYTHGDQLDLTGLVVTLSYDDASIEDVAAANFTSKSITANPSQGSRLVSLTHNGKPVRITYGNLTPLTTNDLTVNAKVITFTIDVITAQTYTGSAIQPAVTVRDGATSLTTADYTKAYSDNINAGTATVIISGAGNYEGSSGSRTFTINKAAGATVSTPTLNTRTPNSIIINAVSVPSTGQSVEYAINTSTAAPSTGWQATTTFSGLSGGTNYYIFARSASNTNYNTGAASNSLAVTTLQSVSSDKIEYYWVDQHNNLVTTSGGATTIVVGSTLIITAQGSGYVVTQWYVDGLDTGQNGNTYSFSSTTAGKHTVSVVVEKSGKLYNTNISITVQ